MVQFSSLVSGKLEDIAEGKRYSTEALMRVLAIYAERMPEALKKETGATLLAVLTDPEAQRELMQALDALGLRRFSFDRLEETSLVLKTALHYGVKIEMAGQASGASTQISVSLGKDAPQKVHLNITQTPEIPDALVVLACDALEELKKELESAAGDMKKLVGSAKFRKIHEAYPVVVGHEERFIELVEQRGWYPAEAAEEIRREQYPPLMATPLSAHFGVRIKPARGRKKAGEWAA